VYAAWLTRLSRPHLDVRLPGVGGVPRLAAQARDVARNDSGLPHVHEQVHRKVLSALILLRRPDRSGVFLLTFKSSVIKSSDGLGCRTDISIDRTTPVARNTVSRFTHSTTNTFKTNSMYSA
jgi:hypothetical protein